MIASAAALVITLLAAGAPAPPPAPAAAGSSGGAPADAFERGKTAFSRGEYQRAIDILRPLLYPDIRLESEGEVVQAHRMLGVSSLFENQPDQARREFRKLLELRPDYRFDPLLDPPRVVDFFNSVLADEKQELAAIQAARQKRDEEAAAARRAREAERLRAETALIYHYQHRPFAVNFIPFGAGQFQNGQRRKGWVFLGVEAALAGASLAAFTTNFALYGVAPRRRCTVAITPCPVEKLDHSDEATSTNLLRTQLVTGGLFFAVAIWGVVDAIQNYQADVLTGVEPAPRRPQAARGGPAFHLSASPFGVGAEWRF
jgi:hypothetical protein